MLGIPLKYNIRHLYVRWVGTVMTALGIALPTAVFCAVMALNNGLSKALTETGDENTIVFLRKSSMTETNSSIVRADAPVIEALPGIERDPKTSRAIVSKEIMILLNLNRIGGTASNVAIRGMSPEGRLLRPNVKLIEGEWPREGLTDVAVARNISERFEHCKIGDRLPLGKRDWRVVGIFDAGTTAYGSEIWGDAETLAGANLRTDAWSSVWVRAKPGELKRGEELYNSGAIPKSIMNVTEAADEKSKEPEMKSVLAAIGMIATSRISDAGLSLTLAPKFDSQLKSMEAFTERDYFRKQTDMGSPIAYIGQFIAIFMAIGAAFAVMNTMYAAVASRGREIAVLRAIGFKRRSVMISFVIESTILALFGGAIGALLSLFVNGISTGTTNFATFSEITFAFQVNAQVMISGAIFGGILGVFGGLFPAWRAARQPITQAMRAI
ncbi:MAG: ABC transporter permease [Planctomycetes bacterium]|nr:ABC transporter permease [Planctomycetota bacterium]